MNIILGIRIVEEDAGLISVEFDNCNDNSCEIMSVEDMQFAAEISDIAINAIKEHLKQPIIIDEPITDSHFGETPIPVPTPVPPIYETMNKKINKNLTI